MSAKRANLFSQGRPDDPYQDRDGPPDPPKRATAAQMAARKIKSVKPRRPGASSGMSQSANFGSPLGGFGSPAPGENGTSSFTGFGAANNGSNDVFGAGTTNSFPPAQPPAPSNNFSNSSFPAFGTSTPGTNFNPQPPSSNGFNFSVGSVSNNPFGASAPAPAKNGDTSTPAFGGSSLFSSQGPSSLFGGPTQNNTNSAPSGSMFGGATGNATQSNTMFGATSSAPQANSIFGATSSAPQNNNMFAPTSNASQNNLFAHTSSASQSSLFSSTTTATDAPKAATTTAPASTPFTFGSPAPGNATPATGSLFSGFGASTQTAPPATSTMFGGSGASTQTAPPAQNNAFNFGSSTPNKDPPSQQAQNSMFGGTSTSAQASTGFAATAPAPASNSLNFASATSNSNVSTPTLFGASSAATPSSTAPATAPAPTSGLFSFNPTAPKNDTPAPSALNTSSAPTASFSAPAPASTPAGNPFANLAPASESTSVKPSLFTPSFTPQAQEKATSTSNNLFSGLTPSKQNNDASSETPKANPFASLTKPASTPTAAPAPTFSGFGGFGAAQKKDGSSGDSKTPSDSSHGPGASKPGLFNAFSTPQPAKTADVDKPAFNTVQSKPGTGLFAKPFTSSSSESSIFNPEAFKMDPKTSGFSTPNKSSEEAPKEAQSTPRESNPFNQQSTPASERPNLFSAPKETPAASPAPQPSTFTGASAGTSRASELPKVPKVLVPKSWPQPGSLAALDTNGVHHHIAELTAQLQLLNDRYRQQLISLPLPADWSAISLWHYQHASDIKKRIDNARKQRAAANGVTGTESALSVKRKVAEDSYENQDPSLSKRARGGDAPATPTPQPSAPTPSLQPTATSTSNMFAKAINGTKSSSSSAGSGLFTPQKADKAPIEPTKSTPAASGFTPSLFTSTASSSSGFKPSFGSTPVGGFKPSTGSSSGGNFMSQFKKGAKTYEELYAERKAKAMAEDFDEDDETEEEWSARYDKEEAERIAKASRQVAESTPSFGAVGSATSSGTATPTSANPFSTLKKPVAPTSASNASTPRAGSPASSTGSQPVLFTASNAPTSANIFGHLSSGPSSNHEEESDEDNGEHQPVGSGEPMTPPTRQSGDSAVEKDESFGESARGKKQETGDSSKGSLLSRMTRDDSNDSGSEKGDGSTFAFGQSSGAQTPTNKPFSFFDFGAASSKPSSPKPDTFAGDQTFKPGTPIKFNETPATDKKGSAPLFQFQPATPAPGEFSTTPAKPPPTSLFNFAPSTGGSSLLPLSAGLSSASSMPSSVFSSRAGTPLSEGDTNASAAENDEEEEGQATQVDFSQLTPEETNANDVIFHTDVVLAKHQVDDGKQKTWANLAKGPIWILKDKKTAKCFVRIRLPNGSTPLNYSILPSIRATVTGSSKKMVLTSKPAKEGGLQSILYAVKSPELAEEFATKYNDSLPSS
ncbi:hypothetical protein IAQ61_001097 [Plenodomus lingam]|uniref:uncharacterized protein n=1 Tax=Leptosphaeria maculans TaxID=5022 RepID=UPI003322DEAC|nr:hypothetical protein IAQ61_001097 [Plenodomus lingam]